MGMNDEDVIRYFDGRLAAFGCTVGAVDWGSAESQRVRFGVLTEVADLTGCRVLDVGSGLGDLAAYLGATVPSVKYVGCDINLRMVETARARFPSGTFVVCDVLTELMPVSSPLDYVLASGLFYLRDEPYLEAMVRRMFNLCRRGVAFNSLSAWGPRPTTGEFSADPASVLRFCRTVTSRVVLRHDYLPHDFTIYLYQDA